MEINLKETPLSEIDLTKIDYEKSYVECCIQPPKNNKIRGISRKGTEFTIIDGEPPYGDFTFRNNGENFYAPNDFTLHLFYKEVRDCSTCLNRIKTSIGFMCDADRCVNRSGWQPKESVKNEKNCSNPHPIIIEYEDLGDTVKILKIEGVMTIDELLKHCGTDIVNKYTDGEKRPSMHMSDGSLYVWCKKDNQFYYHLINRGDKIKKESFFDLIANMKLSAKRLASLIKKPEIKRIEI